MRQYARFSGITFQLLAIIALFTWGGYKIDMFMHHSVYWVTAILSPIGVLLAIFLVIRQLND